MRFIIIASRLFNNTNSFAFKVKQIHKIMNSGYEKDLVTALRDVVNGTNWYCAGPVSKLKKYTCNR